LRYPSIYWYIPNIICYIRIVLLFLALFSDYFVIFYITSAALDLADGYSARTFNQSTVFGARLDMIIDRISNIVIIMKIYARYSKINSHFALKNKNSFFIGEKLRKLLEKASMTQKPKVNLLSKIEDSIPELLLLLLIIDLLSHFLHFNISMNLENNEKKEDNKIKSHKNVKNKILQVYYRRDVLFILCSATEWFFVTFYLNLRIWPFFFIFYLVKNFFHVCQLNEAFKMFLKIN